MWPESAGEVSKIIKLANETVTPVVPYGGGSGVCGGAVPVEGGIALDLKRMDRIRSIDDPVYVSPDDPRLLEIPTSPYREDEVAASNDEIMVVGYVEEGEARAYPTALLDRHEVVNDRISGKPVTVGW